MSKLKFFFIFVLIILCIQSSMAQGESNTTIRIAAVGDIMMGTDYPKNKLPSDDGANLFYSVQEILQDADITFGNLEGVLSDSAKPAKTCNDPSLCYLFRTPTRYVNNLLKAGFDVMSLANNHARDFSEEGRTATMQTLSKVGIHHSGRVGDIASWQVKGLRCAMIAFTANPGSYSILDLEKAVTEVKRLAGSHDIVMVSFHGGKEGKNATHVSHKMEIYYGEERGNVVEFAHAVIDAGADLVIGHGPHVPRALELYNERIIAYSLGNFCTYQGISIEGVLGLSPILIVELTNNGIFVEGKIISTHQVRPSGTLLDVENRVLELIHQLTEEDFPDSRLKFRDDGIILPKKVTNNGLKKF